MDQKLVTLNCVLALHNAISCTFSNCSAPNGWLIGVHVQYKKYAVISCLITIETLFCALFVLVCKLNSSQWVTVSSRE